VFADTIRVAQAVNFYRDSNTSPHFNLLYFAGKIMQEHIFIR